MWQTGNRSHFRRICAEIGAHYSKSREPFATRTGAWFPSRFLARLAFASALVLGSVRKLPCHLVTGVGQVVNLRADWLSAQLARLTTVRPARRVGRLQARCDVEGQVLLRHHSLHHIAHREPDFTHRCSHRQLKLRRQAPDPRTQPEMSAEYNRGVAENNRQTLSAPSWAIAGPTRYRGVLPRHPRTLRFREYIST